MTDKEENKDDKKDDANGRDEKKDIDLNAVGKAFVEHYYTLFDNNRLQLADLYVMSFVYIYIYIYILTMTMTMTTTMIIIIIIINK